MFSYLAYGLGVHSDFPLPEFIAAGAPCDVVVRLDPDAAPADLDEESQVEFRDEEVILGFKHVGVFRIRSGREVLISPAPGADLSIIRLYLVGKVMATLLFQRGRFVLHASAVEVDGRAVAFMGPSCVGKSSIAARLNTCGHKLVSDDVTALDLQSGEPLATPAYPQLKIDPADARSLGHDATSLVPLHPGELRQGLRLTGGFVSTPLRLALIYLLGSEGATSSHQIGLQAGLIELVRHSFPARLLKTGGAAHLRQCGMLAKAVPVLTLTREDARSEPAMLTDRIRRDLAQAHC